jgi:glutamate carboxypeptidase
MKNGTADRVLSYVRSQEQALVELLRHLVDAESPSAQPGSHRLVLSVLREALGTLDFEIRTPRAGSAYRHVFARRSNRRRKIPVQLLLGHYDTVWPLGTTAHRPFVVDANVIRGPGVFDMKGGLAQIVFALRTLRDLDLEPQLEPVIFINADEEIGSRTSTYCVVQIRPGRTGSRGRRQRHPRVIARYPDTVCTERRR